MIADLKPYPATKDSGVPWLGSVPMGWTISPLRHRYDQCLGKMLDTKRILGTYETPYLRNVDVQWDRINTFNLPTMDIAPKEHGRYTLEAGDLLVCEGGEVGRCATWRGDLAVCGYQKALHRLRPLTSADYPRYLYYAFRSAALAGAFMDGHESTIPHLTGDKLRAHRFAFPSAAEQRLIVRFLDHLTRRVRRHIRAKQKLIKLLEEQKRAIVRRAVTRGLDLNVRLKPSGIAWLGDVPGHWEVRKLRQCGSIAGGMTPSMEVQRFWNGGAVPWVTPKDMKRAAIGDSSVRVTNAAIQETSLRLIEPPAILIVVRGMILARRVPIAWTTAPVTINQDMKALQPARGVNAEFLAHSLDSAQGAFVPLIDEAGHGTRRLPTERWREIATAIPPEDEQASIVRFLNGATGAIIAAIDRAQREILLLREYSTRLISDVVTGKLDVREAAAGLPDETTDEAPDETSDVDDALEAEEAEDDEDGQKVERRPCDATGRRPELEMIAPDMGTAGPLAGSGSAGAACRCYH